VYLFCEPAMELPIANLPAVMFYPTDIVFKNIRQK
jgi:hypothetical protein